jgi:hypothetical protein
MNRISAGRVSGQERECSEARSRRHLNAGHSGRSPPLNMIKLSKQREIEPYPWVHPDNEDKRGPQMEDLRRYLRDIVEPTVQDFLQQRSSVRIGFLTCVAIDHSVDYLAFPADRAKWDSDEHRRRRGALRRQFCQENEHFRLASDVANAFKHVKTKNSGLEASQVYERPPALAGRMMAGLSMLGDTTGAVVVDGNDLFETVAGALGFLNSKMK